MASKRRSVQRTVRKVRKRLRRSPVLTRARSRLGATPRHPSNAGQRGAPDAALAATVESVVARLDRLEERVTTLSKQDVPMLRQGLQEQRGLSNRISELADLVTELLVLAAQRDDPEFARIVARYRQGI